MVAVYWKRQEETIRNCESSNVSVIDYIIGHYLREEVVLKLKQEVAVLTAETQRNQEQVYTRTYYYIHIIMLCVHSCCVCR